MTPRDPATIEATLAVRSWAQRRAKATGQAVTLDDRITYVHKHYPDLKGEAVGYVLTYSEPAPRAWS